MVYEIMIKAANRMGNILPSLFELDVQKEIEKADGLLTKEAAAYLVFQRLGFRIDSSVIGDQNAVVFIYHITRVNQGKR